jgi:hypothetical protein
MMLPFEVVLDDIVALTDGQLTQLLHRLLLLEAQRLGLPKRHASVALDIDIADGGQDGRIEWSGGPSPEGSSWIPHRVTLFQVKATDMEPSKCRKEVLQEDGALKPKVADVVARGGAYVLCYGSSCEGVLVERRVAKFREAFASVVGEDRAAAVLIDVYGAEKLAAWSNEHASVITFVKRCLGRSLPADLQTWSSWCETHDTSLSYHLDPQRTEIMAELRAHLSQDGTVARLVGLSGLGKSRLALECFRPPEHANNDPLTATLAAACIYVGDAAGSAEEVRRAMLVMREARIRAILVLDECPLELHEKLEPIAKAPGSTLSLITLDFEPSSHPRSSSCRFFCLEPLDNEHMSALLRDSPAGIPDEHLARIAEFAQGFPRMAQLMVETTRSGHPNLWELASTTAVEKLVVRRSREPDRVLRVASALAVLEHLGIDGVVSYQLDVFAAELCGEARAYTDGVLRELEDAKIAYRRGDYVRLTPLPIAVALAATWWKRCMPPRAQELLLGGVLPADMVDATANQLKRLSGNPWVQDLVTRIYGPTSPFRQRDLLNSATGSRLASSLAEVNPRAVCDALTAAFSTLTPSEAKSAMAGRRDLVWCLQKLAWWPETFEDAAWLLLVLASSENEPYGNNATNQFCELFHVYLSGTETAAMDRLGVLKRAAAGRHEEVQLVLVKALGAALASGHFHRSGDVNAQGARMPREDWKPKTWGDIWKYWEAILELAAPFVVRDDRVGAETRRKVGDRARGMIHWGGLAIVERAVELVLASRAEWPEVLDSLRTALNYEGPKYDASVQKRINDLIARLEPRDLAGRLRTIISTPSWNELRRESAGRVAVVAEERAEQLGRELANELDTLLPYLPALLQGEQRQAYKFGRELARCRSDALGILTRLVDILRGIPVDHRNPLLAMGVAASAAEQEPVSTRAYVRGLFSDPVLRVTAVDLVRAISANDEDIALISRHLAAGELPSSCTHAFTFGGVLHPLREETVAELVTACADSDEHGPFFALELLGMRIHGQSLGGALIGAARSLLMRPGLMQRFRGAMSEHHFQQLTKAYLSLVRDDEFAAVLTQRIIESIGADEGFPAGETIRELLSDLLRGYVESCWPVMAKAFITEDGQLWLRLTLTLEKLPLEDLVGDARLLEWCCQEPTVRHWVARMIDPLSSNGSAPSYPAWTPFAVALLDEFGSDPDVRSSLSASIYSGTWQGSAVPRLTEHRDAFKEMTRHANSDVSRWAQDAVNALEADIERERKRDEEQDFGIFR